MEARAERFITEDEYMRLEEGAGHKHEWLGGRVFAMAGGTPAHALLCLNAGATLREALRGQPCRASGSEQRVSVEATGLKTYPDALVVCPPERYGERDPNSLLNPTVVVEVLSPSTEKYDRTTKFDHFKQIESLCHYLLISSDRVRVELFTRAEGGFEGQFESQLWTQQTFTAREQAVSLSAVGVALALEDIYERLELPQGLAAIPEDRGQA